MSDPRILKWLQRFDSLGGIEGASDITLRSQPHDTPGTAIIAKAWPPPDGLTSEDYAADFYASALDDAGGLPTGVHTYVLLATNKKGATLGRCAFRVRAEGDEEPGLLTEAPNASGLTAAAMRHTEAMARSIIPAWTELQRTYQRDLARREEYIVKLEKNALRTHELQEQLMSRIHERELSFAEERRKQEMADEAFEMARTYLPTFASMVGKKYKLLPPVGSKQADPRLMLVKQFVSTLTADQFSALQEKLTDAQKLTMIELIEAVKPEVENDLNESDKRREASEQKLRERMRGPKTETEAPEQRASNIEDI